MAEWTIERLNLALKGNRDALMALLDSQGIGLDDDVDYTLGAWLGDRLVGTGSKAGNVLKCIAADPELQGEGLATALIERLIDRLFQEGKHHWFLFTLPEKVHLFQQIGFEALYTGRRAALLEGGMPRIEERLKQHMNQWKIPPGKNRGALVMNCNPFTLGHRHLIEEASKRHDEVLVFVVEEDRSVFHFEERFQLVSQGTADLPNVRVLPGTEYIISQSTFPSYFLRTQDEQTEGFMEIDAGIFCNWFCPTFGVSTRYVGEEPYCDVTESYNRALKRVFEDFELQLIELPRLTESSVAISASRVREGIREGNPEAVKALLPETTWDYLFHTREGREAVERVRNNNAPH